MRRSEGALLAATLARRVGAFSLEVALEVAAGETLVVVGESGAGKSTLLRLLAGLERPDAGRIAVGGSVWWDADRGIALPPWQRAVGYLAQDYALFPHLSAAANVRFGLAAQGRPEREVRARVAAMLDRLGIGALALRRPRELSGGQQQRVALARALVLAPDVLLLDEPLSALDVRTRQSLRAELRALLDELPCATLYVTHQPAEALTAGGRIAALEGGRVTQVGTREELLRRPRSPYVAAFLGTNVFFGPILGRGEGLARVRAGRGEIAVLDPGGDAPVFAVVRPRDVALFLEPPAGSAQNVFAGPVLELSPEPPDGERVRVAVGAEPPLVAELTARAVGQLGLRDGVRVHAMFKATGVDVFR